MASNSTILADGDGEFSDWIEIYNPTGAAVSLTGCYMTDNMADLDKWIFPASASIVVPPNGYIIVYASGKSTDAVPYVDGQGRIHATFKLSASGESVALVNIDGLSVISAIQNYPTQLTDVAYGLGSNAVTGYLQAPTPGAENGLAGGGIVADTNFSVHRGFFTDPTTVTITCATPGVTILYTLDGSTPNETHGTTFTLPLAISATSVLRAVAYKPGWISTDVDTQTYIFPANIIAQPAAKPSTDWPDPTTGSATVQAMDYEMDPEIVGDPTYGPLMQDALLAVPSISLVTDLPNLFDPVIGIYANPGNDGIAWERPVSAELLLPGGAEGFHVNAGLRIRGGASTAMTNPKHSFRIIMRTEYGDSKLEYPVFGPTGPDKFDKLDFRTAQNFSWNHTNPAEATWLDDPFSRDSMRDMGHPYTRGFFFHLYLNGVYWGMFQTEERPDAYYAETYFGGNEDDYDVIKPEEDNGAMEATDGTLNFYNDFWTQVNAGVTSNSAYLKLQGLNPDGTPNLAYPKYLDVDNLADYMLLIFFTGAKDTPLGPPDSYTQTRNIYAIANRVEPEGFTYLMHDNEWSLMPWEGVNFNRVSAVLNPLLSQQGNFNPWWLHLELKNNAEYRLRFADRVRKHMFGDGALTPAACSARYQASADEIQLAILAESARWGDSLSPATPRTRDADWLPAVQWVLNSYFNATPNTRTDIVLTQLQAAGLYPSVAAPELSQNGGTIVDVDPLSITAAVGTIYFTTDGSDPRAIGGAPAAGSTSGLSGMLFYLTESVTVKARALEAGVWSALTEADFSLILTPAELSSFKLD